MPVIKRTRTEVGTRISTRVPGVRVPETSGIVERATGQAFQALTNIGLDILAKEKRVRDNNFANETALQDRIALAENDQKLKLEMPEDGAGYADAYEKFARDRFEKNLKEAPGNDAAQKYRERALPQLELEIAKAKDFQTQTGIKSARATSAKTLTGYARMQILNPDIDMALADINKTQEQINDEAGVLYFQPEVPDLIKGYQGNIAKSYFEGLIASGNPSLMRMAQSAISGADPKGAQLIEHLEGEDIARLKRRIDSEFKSASNLKASDAFFVLNNAEKALMAGNITPGLESDALRVVMSAPNISTEKKVAAKASIEAARLVGESKQILGIQSPAEMAETLKGFETSGSFIEANAFNEKKAALLTLMSQEIKLRKKDAAQSRLSAVNSLQALSEKAASGTPEDTQAYYAAQIAAQNQINLEKPFQKILTNDQAKRLGQQMEQLPADAAVLLIRSRQEAAGEFFPKEVKEIVQASKIKEDYFLIAHVPSPAAQENIIANIRNEKVISDDFKKRFPEMTPQLLGQAIESKLAEFVSALSQHQGDEVKSRFINGMRNQVRTETQKLMNRGVKRSDAIEGAVQTMITDNFSVAAGGRSKVLVPVGNSNEMVEAFLESHSTPEALEDLGYRVPPGYSSQLNKIGVTDIKEIRRRFFKDLSERGRWVLNDEGTGVQFVTIDGNRKSFRTTEAGEQPEFLFKDMTLSPNKRLQREITGAGELERATQLLAEVQ